MNYSHNIEYYDRVRNLFEKGYAPLYFMEDLDMKLFKKKKRDDIKGENLKRNLTGWQKTVFAVIAIAMAVFHIYVLGFHSISPYYLYNIHTTFALVILFGLNTFSKKSNHEKIVWYDWILIGITLTLGIYLFVNSKEIIYRLGVMPTQTDVIFGAILILLVLEATRRTSGGILPVIAIIFLLYAKYGHNIPGMLGHTSFTWSKIFSFMLGMDAIYGTPISASAKTCFLFLIFSSFLVASGAGDTFIDLAIGAAGKARGGPAKVSVVASSLFGTISGNSVANVLSTGAFTIPMMKRIGYSNVFSGAVEAVASTGGQIMPPIMGAAAFIMATTLGMPYSRIMGAALLPVILYYLAVFLMVDLEAVKNGLHGLSADELPNIKEIIKKRGLHFVPLLVIILALTVFNTSIIRSALLGIVASIIASLISSDANMIKHPKNILTSLEKGANTSVSMVAACACAGIITGVLNLTGTGLKFAGAVIKISGGNLFITMLLTMLVCLVLGMGLPTAAAYIVTSAIAVPAMTQLGVSPLAAHMFCFYFACVSAITPPVALAAYAGAQIAGADAMKVGFTATKLGIVAFVVPYMFVYGEELLGNGAPLSVAIAAVTSIIGVIGLSISLQGWYFNKKKATVPGRILLLVGAFALLVPGTITDLIGIALFVAAFIIDQFIFKNKGGKK